MKNEMENKKGSVSRKRLKPFRVYYFKIYSKVFGRWIDEPTDVLKSKIIWAWDKEDATKRFEKGQVCGDIFTEFESVEDEEE